MIIKEGREYARVTEVLKPFSDFSHIDPEVLANKCRIGTQVHAAIESEIKDEFPILAADSYGYFKSFLLWKGRMNCTFSQSEKRYFSDKFMITGQIDTLIYFYAHFKESITNISIHLPVLVDFKTSASEGESWCMQAHLYHLLLTENEVNVEPLFLFVKLDKKGDLPKVFQYKFQKNIASKCLNAIEKFWKVRKSCSNLIAPPI